MARLVFVLLVLGLVQADHSDWKPERVHFIDSAVVGTTRNFLFRGNEPTVKNQTTGALYWPLNAFKEQLAKVAQQEGNLTLPSDFFLIDVDFENVVTEATDINAEKHVFDSQQQDGKLINWPMIGDLTDPAKYPSSVRESMAKRLPHWQVDKLSAHVPEINQMLHTKQEKPVVIYFHCEAGEDRTGEFCGAYQMHFLNFTYAAALKYADSIETRNIHKSSQNGMDWYCWYLKYGLKQAGREC
mmetsp:Transcript_52904/g.123634  ORF Transcript_52904/g.123634 Transcript_52904/m.123634 type:complete len:242 (+) Transcript_52904:4-729(+)